MRHDRRPLDHAYVVAAGGEAIAAYAMVGFEGEVGFDRGAAAPTQGLTNLVTQRFWRIYIYIYIYRPSTCVSGCGRKRRATTLRAQACETQTESLKQSEAFRKRLGPGRRAYLREILKCSRIRCFLPPRSCRIRCLFPAFNRFDNLSRKDSRNSFIANLSDSSHA